MSVKTEDRGQRTEDGRQRAEGSGPRAAAFILQDMAGQGRL
ncbi:hypothetical protein ACFL4N_09575 [Thermodesulfobacteriota bacterium]